MKDDAWEYGVWRNRVLQEHIDTETRRWRALRLQVVERIEHGPLGAIKKELKK